MLPCLSLTIVSSRFLAGFLVTCLLIKKKFPAAKCVDINLSYCDDVPYAKTVFPNPLGHRTREEAELGTEYLLLSVVEALLTSVVSDTGRGRGRGGGGRGGGGGGADYDQCYLDVRLLGCAVVTPRCEKDRPLRACRRVCEAARRKCSGAFEAIDMAWPYFLDCERFFAGEEEESCYDPLEGLRRTGDGEIRVAYYNDRAFLTYRGGSRSGGKSGCLPTGKVAGSIPGLRPS